MHYDDTYKCLVVMLILAILSFQSLQFAADERNVPSQEKVYPPAVLAQIKKCPGKVIIPIHSKLHRINVCY